MNLYIFSEVLQVMGDLINIINEINLPHGYSNQEPPTPKADRLQSELSYLDADFFNVGPSKESIFLTTIYGLYFSHHYTLQITFFFMHLKLSILSCLIIWVITVKLPGVSFIGNILYITEC